MELHSIKNNIKGTPILSSGILAKEDIYGRIIIPNIKNTNIKHNCLVFVFFYIH